MTEPEWLNCADPQPMLEFLGGKGSDRKLRLFCCACNRRIRGRLYEGWDTFFPPIIDLAERYVDGQVSDAQMEAVQIEANIPANDLYDANEDYFRRHSNALLFAVCAGALATYLRQRDDFLNAILSEYRTIAKERSRVGAVEGLVGPEEASAQAGLLRDIFGNPFHVVAVHPAGLTWDGGTVFRLADSIYAERAFEPDRLAVLADALEEAGCPPGDLLAHLRGPGPHVKGCFAVDAILGKM